ncbi:MAG: hypothetical protein R3C03_02680 [Pirellulaceae bacterium]
MIEYRGRLAESFYESFPEIFKWMSTQRRRYPNRDDKLEISCEIFRPWDNRYFFL